MDLPKRGSNESQQKRSSRGSREVLGASGSRESTEYPTPERKASHAILGSHDVRRPSQHSSTGSVRIGSPRIGSPDLGGARGVDASHGRLQHGKNGSQEDRLGTSGSQDTRLGTSGSQDTRLGRSGSPDIGRNAATNGSQEDRLGRSGSQDTRLGRSGSQDTRLGRSGSPDIGRNAATNGSQEDRLGRSGSQDTRLGRSGSQDLEGTRGPTGNGSQEMRKRGSQDIGSHASLNGNQADRRGRSGSQDDRQGRNGRQDDRRGSQDDRQGRNGSQDDRLGRSGSKEFENAATEKGSQNSRNPNNQEKGSTAEFQIKFYGHFAERVVSNLKDMKEKGVAGRWVLFLDQQAASQVRAEYLKQLLVVCLHGRLAGVFADEPQEPLQPLPEHHTTDWLARQISIAREKEKIDVQQDLSSDRAEYLAVQRIPYFGTQCFFAISDEPIETWENAPTEAELP